MERCVHLLYQLSPPLDAAEKGEMKEVSSMPPTRRVNVSSIPYMPSIVYREGLFFVGIII